MQDFQQEFERHKMELMAEMEHQRLISEEKSALPGELSIGSFFGQETPIKKSSDYLNAMRGWVHACVNARAEAVASIEFKLKKVNVKGEVKEVTESPILDLLYKVNPAQTKFDFWYQVQAHLDLVGEAPVYVLKKDISNKPHALMSLVPDRFSPDDKGDKDSFLPYGGFKYRTDDGKEVKFDLNEILFLKYPNPAIPYRGLGILAAISKTVDIDDYAEDYNANFFFNSARPDALLTTSQILSKKQKEDLRLMLKQTYSGKKNAHKQMVLDHGFTYTQLGMNRKDMDFLEQSRFTRDKILALFRVPKSIIAISDDVNYANAKTHQIVFLEHTIRPLMTRLVEQLNEFLLPLFPNEYKQGYFIDFDNPVPEDQEMKLRYYQGGIDGGWLTPNEVRANENLEPIEGGDEARKLNGSLFNFGKRAPYVNRRLAGITSKEKQEETKKRKNFITALEDKFTNIVKNKTKRKIKKLDEKVLKQYWHGWNKKALDSEEKIKHILLKLAGEQEAQITWKMNATKAAKSDINNWIFDIEDETRIWIQGLSPELTELMILQGQEAMKLIGEDPSKFTRLLEPVQAWIKDHVFKFAQEANELTIEKLKETLIDGIGQGEGIPDLTKRVKEVFVDFDSVRAERIARTETLLASNQATLQAYDQSSLVSAKEWLIADDSSLCPLCAAIYASDKLRVADIKSNFFNKGDSLHYTDQDGKEHNFTFDYRDVDAPPAHVNCRCTTAPIFDV